MSKILKYNSIFIFSDSQQKYFYCDFQEGINIIHGANTSGKSTLIQTILYIFGVNDVKRYLDPVYLPDSILRLDCSILEDGYEAPMTIIRSEGSICVKVGSSPIQSFEGITGNNSFEHKRLKSFFRELLGFNLLLMQKDEYIEASIEVLFLPYYISQAVGWVSFRKTFEGLEFYKNFKDDYLDYYLGINLPNDLVEKIKLENEKKALLIRKDILEQTIQNEPSMVLANIENDALKDKCVEYVNQLSKNEGELQKLQNNYIELCNELEFFKIRKRLLSKIKSNQSTQNPIQKGCCPLCKQELPYNISIAYQYLQKYEDTESELKDIKLKINTTTASIDSTACKIKELTSKIEKKREILNKYSDGGLTMEQWLDNQAKVLLLSDIESEKGNMLTRIDTIDKELKTYKSDKDIEALRNQYKYKFKASFIKNLACLNVPIPDDDRFTDLYKITALPHQGVELLKAMFAYHFAFNDLIKSNKSIHRMPFMLDAIFKEDIDTDNKKLILQFVKNNHPSDTQTIFSMADKHNLENQLSAVDSNRAYFDNLANLIHVSDQERSLLKDWVNDYDKMKEDTILIMEGN